MAEQLTIQQKQAVEDRGGKLLVSAAAGSGKTKVLVDRLLSYILDPADPANIDDFLIITYTKAAAAELRGKIAAKLSERILENPENRHLQQQMQRLYLAKISTVHSFCADLLREYAYRLDVSGDFRVAEENECSELQQRVMEQLLDSAYDNAQTDADFRAFVDSQGLGRDDRQVPQIVLQVYSSARCHLDPQGWLQWCLSVNDVSGLKDAGETVWGKYLIDDLQNYIQLQINALNACADLAENEEGMEKPVTLLRDTIYQLQKLYNTSNWDEIHLNMNIDYGRLTFNKQSKDSELAGKIKAIREACKKGLTKKLRRFSDTSEQVLQDIAATGASARGLVGLVEKFMEAYTKLKRSRHVLDFSDLEHIALDLLLGKKRSGPTAVAEEIGSRFREVMVDEYQDSNAVQDAIFEAITGKKQNCFMVGDVKQSIYQFRLADPDIFLQKYRAYVSADTAVPGQGRKILLSKNFRSATAVIDAVNDVFTDCMSEAVGGLDYGPEEALQEGLEHTPVNEPEIELHAITVHQSTYDEEADYTAERISQLLDGSHMVRQKGTLRVIRPEDIVILLRSPGSVGRHFAAALERRGIRCSFGGSIDILKTEEIQTLRAILQVIDNPLQDIPLLTALTSRVFLFTADDLAQFRGGRRTLSMYDALRESKADKALAFLRTLDELRSESRMCDLSRLLQSVFARTKIDCIFGAMTDGNIRTENLRSFCQLAAGFDSGDAKSLSRFLKHLEALDENGVPGVSDQMVPGAVTIMSIHKSKGLEFPVVFLCCLSRAFNRDNTRAQILCDKELGLGLSCVDPVNRVRYPSVAKRAISAKMLADSLSEEMRVLYVAMTRPKDRLIMTYAAEKPENVIFDLVQRMDMTDPLLLTGDVDCPGKWVILSALRRGEAGAFFKLGGYPNRTKVSDLPWKITVGKAPEPATGAVYEEAVIGYGLPESAVERLKEALSFRYAHSSATQLPSKQTATQLKGRYKDAEAAEDTRQAVTHRSWRVPAFIGKRVSGVGYGTALHAAMQYISYDACGSLEDICSELERLRKQEYLSEEYIKMIDPKVILDFFETDIGKRLRRGSNVLREFKFSILMDAGTYYEGVSDEQVLLQGVVDCALIEDDGITVVDFKTDRIPGGNVDSVAERYRQQVRAYAQALSRIYSMPVKETLLYFFSVGRFVEIQ